MLRFRTIVVPVDFSETSHDAVKAAVDLARQGQGTVRLIHVVADGFHTPSMAELAGVDFPEITRRWIEEAEERLQTFAVDHHLDSARVTTAVAVGAPAAEIVRYAREHAADLIVLGSHGHGAFRRFMLGSVAERVIRQAGCPVMVVPHRRQRVTSSEVEALAAQGT